VTVTTNSTFTLTAVGAGGTVKDSVVVFVAKLPTATFTATPSSLPIGGGKVVLKWTTQNTLNASINQGIGAVKLNDSLIVMDTASTTYVLTLSGNGGTVQYYANCYGSSVTASNSNIYCYANVSSGRRWASQVEMV